MLTESFIASTRAVEEKTNATTAKDVGVHVYDYQPNPSLRSSFRKSSTQPNCLAANATHIFAAQAEKSAVHVYSRERGNQEAVVPFQEKITCLALAGRYHGAGTLALGTRGGRLLLWELATGRQISTLQSHLQSVTCLAVDPTLNFLISGSSDSNLHVWSIASLLSFSQLSQDDSGHPSQLSPQRTLSNHRAAVNAVIFGHSASKANFAISVAKDQTCIVWNYIDGTLLHTYLLGSNPLCLALDPADRAAYVGFEDGSIQILNFYKKSSLIHPLYDPDQQSTPTQAPSSDRWPLPDSSSFPNLCIQVSYDSTALLSGHENGKIQTWNIAKGKYNTQLADFNLPVTNLSILPPTGFPNAPTPNLKLHSIVKPRYESSLDSGNAGHSNSIIPSNYAFTAQFTSALSFSYTPAHYGDLDNALTHPSFPTSILEEGIAELAALNDPSTHGQSTEASESLRKENAHLKTQLDNALRRQREAITKVLGLEKDRFRREEDEVVKRARKKRRRVRLMEAEERRRKVVMGEDMGEGDGDGEMEMGEEREEDFSSDTDEMSSD
ncbi:MAG: hypothetical protein LQ343_001840 [Gyalolechia ehrenbergii]|nr:MAG: hypothetical protein LQ343_001840 [Gyalolechia ehrenbergii]